MISLIEELTALGVQLYRWTSKLFAALVVEQGLTTVRVERFRRDNTRYLRVETGPGWRANWVGVVGPWSRASS